MKYNIKNILIFKLKRSKKFKIKILMNGFTVHFYGQPNSDFQTKFWLSFWNCLFDSYKEILFCSLNFFTPRIFWHVFYIILRLISLLNDFKAIITKKMYLRIQDLSSIFLCYVLSFNSYRDQVLKNCSFFFRKGGGHPVC